MARSENRTGKRHAGDDLSAAAIKSTSSAAAHHASPSPARENSLHKLTLDGSGRTSHESFAYYDPATSLLKTSQVCLDGEQQTYSETLPRSGTMSNGKLYQRQPLVRHTGGTESGSLPTPVVTDAYGSGSRNTPGSKAHPGLSLTDYVRGDGGTGRMWPTPKGSPSGPDYARRDREGSGGDDLVTAIGGQLNPTWVEWLMGYPLGWTDSSVSGTA